MAEENQREILSDYISKNQGYIAQNHPTPKIPTVTNKQGKQIAPTPPFVENKGAKASINIKKKKAAHSSTMKPTIKKHHANELKRHIFIFRHISKGSAKKRDIVLKNAPLSFYKSIRLLFNLMKNGSIPLKKTHKPRVGPWVNFIRKNSKGRLVDIKRDVSQQGGGLGTILKAVLPIVTPILSMLF